MEREQIRILAGDEDPDFVSSLRARLAEIPSMDITLEACRRGEYLIPRIYGQPFDLILIDLALPGLGGVDVLSRLSQTSLPLPIVTLSEENDSRPAVEAMKRGVLDHVLKKDLAVLDLLGFLNRTLTAFKLKRENAELHQIGKMKNDFLATISHELRTPLTTIMGLSELLLSGRLGDLGGKPLESLHRIHDQSQNLARLINQLLDVQETLIEKTPADLRPLDLCDIVEVPVQALRLIYEKKGVSLSFTPPDVRCTVAGNREFLSKVVEHLLTNALKFTPSGGHVTVSQKAMPGSSVLLSVQDTGQGIPQELLPFVFEKFFHADTRLTRPTGGLGLGLAWCHHVVSSHGGRIWLESPGVGQGTTVNITFPRLKNPSLPLSSTDQKTIFWVDDNPHMLELAQAGFSALPKSVKLVTCQSGTDALERILLCLPDLIVLDMMMPDMNGLEVLNTLKSQEETRPIPVLAVTGYRDAALKALEQGALDYFIKPFPLSQILKRIREIIGINGRGD